MSHVASVTPTSATLNLGQSVDFAVSFTGIPADETQQIKFSGSDGSAIVLNVTLDRASAAAVLTGTPAANEIKGEVVTGNGTLTVVSVTAGVATFRFTAPSS